MKIITFYFSGTGNTEWIVKKFDTLAKSSGHVHSYFSVFNIGANDIGKHYDSIVSADYIVLAFPLYGADIPRYMRNFIISLYKFLKKEDINRKKLIVINNFGYVNGAGVFLARKYICSSLLELKMYVNIRTSNTAPSLKRKRAVIGDNLNIKVKNKALEQLKKVLRRIDDGRNLIQGIGPHLIIGCLIRSILRNAIRDNYLKMHVDMNSCTECMICVRNCPTKSIYIKDKSFLFSNSCESCMRCYNNCPVHAISNRKL